MAIHLQIEPRQAISIDCFMGELASLPSVRDADALVDAAPLFSDLACNKDMLPSRLNEAIKVYLRDGPLLAYTPQSIVLGRERNFLVRANIWTPLQLSQSFRSHEERVFSYRNTHDHNFSFMTAGYFGPGYDTDLYEYDPDKVKGYVGELVDLEYAGRSTLSTGKIMVYRNKVDVHTQLPPASLSISLNIVLVEPALRQQDQYFFDPQTRKIIDLPEIAFAHKRASIIAMMGYVGNPDTADILQTLSAKSGCRRVREASLTAIARLPWLGCDEKARMIEIGLSDVDEIVRNRASGLIARFDESVNSDERPTPDEL